MPLYTNTMKTNQQSFIISCNPSKEITDFEEDLLREKRFEIKLLSELGGDFQGFDVGAPTIFIKPYLHNFSMELNKTYFIRVLINNSLLTYTGKIKAVDELFVVFIDRYGREISVNKTTIQSYEVAG